MTNTLTTDVPGTVAQIDAPNWPAWTSSVCRARIRRAPRAAGHRAPGRRCPIVADIHFHYKRALEAAESGAACLRINPGNIGSDERVGRC